MNIDKWFKIAVSIFKPEDYNDKTGDEFVVKRMVSQTKYIKIEDDKNSVLEAIKMRDIKYPEIAKTALEISDILKSDSGELLAKVEVAVQSKLEEWETIITYTKKICPNIVRKEEYYPGYGTITPIDLEASTLWKE